MSETVTGLDVIQLGRLGLRTVGGISGDPAQDGLLRAENVVSVPGALVPRRHLADFGEVAGKTFDRLGLFAGQMVLHATDGSLFLQDVESGGEATQVEGLYLPTDADGARVRTVEAARSLFIASRGGLTALDTVDGTPRPAGAPAGLDCDGALSTEDGTAIPGDCQVAYRVCFGRRDAHGRLILGSPSGRAVVESPVLDVAVGMLVRTSGAVLVTLANHGLVHGEKVVLTGSDPLIPDGTYTVAVLDSSHFSFPSAGEDGANTVPCWLEKTTRNVFVSANIPLRTRDGGYFCQVYRSHPSPGAEAAPGDEMGLVAEVAVPDPVQLSSLVRAGTEVTATTATPHAFGAGTLVSVPEGLAGASSQIVAVGVGATDAQAARSTDDGASWADHATGLPSNPMGAALTKPIWTGSRYVVGGADFINGKYLWRTARSATGQSWTVLGESDGLYVFDKCWFAYGNGVLLRLVRYGATGVYLWRSTDEGGTWTNVWGGYLPDPLFDYIVDRIIFDGTKFIGVGRKHSFVPPLGYFFAVVTSVDGQSWSGTSFAFEDPERYPYGYTYPYDFWRDIAANGAGGIVAVGSHGVVFSTDGGATWTKCAAPPGGSYHAATWSPTRQLYYAVGEDCCATTATGAAWAVLPAPSTTSPRGAATYYDVKEVGGALYACGTGALIKSTDGGQTWTTTYPETTATFVGLAGSPGSSIPPGTYEVTDVPSSTTFRFRTASSGDIASTPTSQTVTPITVGVLDTVAPKAVGAAAYWNASQEGGLAAHDVPPDCLDVVEYKGHLLYAAPQRAPAVFATLLAVGAGGLQAGDKVHLPGGDVIAGETEDWATRTFRVATDSAQPELNVFRTTQSLVRVINRNPGLGVTAYHTATPSSATTGSFAVVAGSPHSSASISFTVAAGAPWSPAQGQTVTPARELNVVAYSLTGIPDAVPFLNTVAVGRADKAILRLCPLRDSVLVWKEDGLFRWTGSSPTDFAVEPLDLSCRLLAPESVAVLDNVAFALTSAGVVAATDAGVTIVSDDIAPDLQALAAPEMRSASSALAFGVAYESDRTYTLWTPSAPDDTYATRGWTYSVATGLWTERTDARAHALILNDRLWAVRGSKLYRERKALDHTDFDLEDGSVVPSVIAWRARYVPQLPQRWMHAGSVSFVFGNLHLVDGLATFSSDLVLTPKDVSLDGAALGLGSDPTLEQPRAVRVLVPRDYQRCTRLLVSFTHRDVNKPFRLEGLALTVSSAGGNR